MASIIATIIGNVRNPKTTGNTVGKTVLSFAGAAAVAFSLCCGSAQAQTTLGTGAAAGFQSTALGTNASALSFNSLAIGTNAITSGTNYATAVGTDARATTTGTALGGLSSADFGGTALGTSSFSGQWGVAVGTSAVSGSQGVSVGWKATSASTAVAIGESAKAQAENSVAIGWGAIATEANTVSFGSGNVLQSTYKNRLVNVADGVAASDVATVGQVNASLSGVTAAATDAQISAQTAQAIAMDAYMAADEVYGVAIDAQNNAALAMEKVEQVSIRLNELSARVGNMQTEYRAGLAGVAAMQTTLPMVPPGRSAMALGAGHFGGQGAIAFSYAKASLSGAVYSAGVSMNASHGAIRVGVAWLLD